MSDFGVFIGLNWPLTNGPTRGRLRTGQEPAFLGFTGEFTFERIVVLSSQELTFARFAKAGVMRYLAIDMIVVLMMFAVSYGIYLRHLG